MQESAGILLTEQQRPPLFGLPSHGMEAAGLWSATLGLLAIARSRRQFSWESEAFISLGQSWRLTGSIHSRHSSDVALQIEEAGLLQLQPMKMSIDCSWLAGSLRPHGRWNARHYAWRKPRQKAKTRRRRPGLFQVCRPSPNDRGVPCRSTCPWRPQPPKTGWPSSGKGVGYAQVVPSHLCVAFWYHWNQRVPGVQLLSQSATGGQPYGVHAQACDAVDNGRRCLYATTARQKKARPGAAQDQPWFGCRRRGWWRQQGSPTGFSLQLDRQAPRSTEMCRLQAYAAKSKILLQVVRPTFCSLWTYDRKAVLPKAHQGKEHTVNEEQDSS